MGKSAAFEFTDHIDDRRVLCAAIAHGDDYGGGRKEFNLPCGHTPEQFDRFVSDLNFEYDDGYGGQELFGTIWYADGTWSERGEYDGSEWWEHHVCPPIPSVLAAGAAK